MEIVPENSEDENEMNLINTNKPRNRNTILDSDSECEDAVVGHNELSAEEEPNIARKDENEISLLDTKKPHRRNKIVDSDSDCEDAAESYNELSTKVLEEEPNTEKEVYNVNHDTIQKKKRKRIAVVDNDSDEETSSNNKNNVVTEQLSENEDKSSHLHNENFEKNKIVTNFNSDSEEYEDEITPHNKSFPDEESAVAAVIYTTNSKGELIQENTSVIQKTRLSALCDSESEEETERNTNGDDLNINDTVLQPKVYRPRRKKKEDGQPERMTAQDAARQKNEIQSESQRRLRESNISLPYHKPKSYTIKEFLQKRSKLASALPPIPKVPPSLAMKMSKDQLEVVSKKLDQRIKEVEEFYKSESEEDEEESKESKEDVSEEIRGWLNLLVDSAVDTAENKKTQLTVEEDQVEELSCEEEVETNKSPEPSNEQQSMECDFNLDEVNESKSTRKSNISELLKDKLNIQPRLSGTPDDIIDLETGVTKPNEVRKLVERYFEHTTKRVAQKHKVELNVVGVGTRGQIVQETVSMNVEEEKEPALVETPGAKLNKLREELQQQMAQRRLELWKQKHEQGDCLVVEKKIEDGEYQTSEKDILDDEEEEFEMTESESDEMDDDEEEYDVPPEKPEVKSAFLDDEADEEDMEEIQDDCDDDGNEDEVDDADDNEGEDENKGFDGEVEENVDNEDLMSPKKKVLKRILKPFAEDFDDEEEDSGQSQDPESVKVVKYYTTDEDDVIPPNLPKLNKTSQRIQPEKNKSEFEFLTPVTYLTGLQNLNSDSKSVKESPSPPFRVPENPSPLKEVSSESSLQKNLFPENSQENVEDLALLCSGTFPETQNCESRETIPEEPVSSTQDLLNVCSGEFATLPASDVTSTDQNKQTRPTNVFNMQTNAEKEIKNLDDDHDQIISQLLDEDELERFKKKFESPINPTIRRNQVLEDVEEVNATGLINSDDESEGLEVVKKKRQKKLVFSDDEEESSDDGDDDVEQEHEEQIDLHDSDDEEQQLENEIVEKESSNFKLADFLDKEAELSESEWGSADEDEKGFDEFEAEQGDQETFNENKVRRELERIHMRQLLDEDNRDVKLLQEMLLEDGELHGTGRKRQFRWKTLDSVDNGEFEKRDDDDIYLDEEESEEQWRKMRYKREMFLKKKSVKEDDIVLSDSQILNVGQKIFKSKSLSSQNNTPVNTPEENKNPFSVLSKRGSFLSRGDLELQRMAEYNKVATTVGSTAKNSKCFVFQTVETSETTVVKDNNNKRKAAGGTPNIIKKLRLDDLSPANGKKQAGKNSRAKKLFGNW